MKPSEIKSGPKRRARQFGARVNNRLPWLMIGTFLGAIAVATPLIYHFQAAENKHPIAQHGAWERVQEQGMITIGIDPAYFPMEFIDVSGELQGFDVDFARALGEKLGVKVNLKRFPMHYLMKVIFNLQIDAVISSFEITPHRSGYLSLVNYFNMPQSLVYSKDFKGDPWKKTIATMTKSTVRKQMNQKLKGAQIRGYESLAAMQVAYMDLDVDGFVIDTPLLSNLTPKVREVSQFQVAEGYSQEMGVAIHPMHINLTRKITEAVEKLKSEGFFKKHQKKWFDPKKIAQL